MSAQSIATHLIKLFGETGEHPLHPKSQWQAHVAAGETILGYWGWLAEYIDNAGHAPHDLRNWNGMWDA